MFQSDDRKSDRLTSWKEIADHFGKTVRTVQKWEKEEGMPVHRHTHLRQSSVYADRAELDAWWELRLRSAHRGPRFPRLAILQAGGVTLSLLLVLLVRSWPDPGAGASAPPDFATATWEGSSQGRPWQVSIGDFNGDLEPDLAVIMLESSQVLLLFGPEAWMRGGRIEEKARVEIRLPPDQYGGSIQSGDVDGDSIDDLVISASFRESPEIQGTASNYLLLGRKTWPQVLELPLHASVLLELQHRPDARLSLCASSSSMTDVDGDGFSDLLLSAPEYSAIAPSAGAVFLITGRPRWPARVDLEKDAHLIVKGERMGEGLSGPCATGDVDGDGNLDLAVFASEATLWEMLGGAGRILIFKSAFRQSSRLLASQAEPVFPGDQPHSGLSTIGMADLDGDGRSELIAAIAGYRGSPQFPGEVRIWSADQVASAERPAQPRLVLKGDRPGGGFGQALALADLDQDSRMDLLVGEKGGRLHLFWGVERLPRGDLPSGDLKSIGSSSGDPLMGIQVGDLDADCLPDLIIDSPHTGGADLLGLIRVIQPHQPVRIDLRPGTVPNLIVPGGLSAVRIFGSPRLGSLDQDRIRLASAAAIEVVEKDYDGDGVIDTQAYFRNEELRLEAHGRCAALTTRSRQGWPVAGSDRVELPQLSTP